MKKVWVWVLPLVLGLLLLWTVVRERFVATPSIKAPPYGKEDKIRFFDMVHQRNPRPPYNVLGYQDILMDKAKATNPTETDTNKLKEIGGGLLAPTIEDFFTSVYTPATTPITEANIDSFLRTRPSDINMVKKDVLMTYFIGQSGIGQGARTGYADILTELGQGQGYLQTSPSPNPPPPTGFYKTGELSPYGGGGYNVPDTGSVPGGGKGTQTGTTTGGTSTSSYGPTSGGVSTGGGATGGGTTGGKTTGGGTTGGIGTGALIDGYGSVNGKQVYGPPYSGQDTSSLSGGRVDTTRTTRYPELMGGMVDTSTRIPGVGVVPPSKNWMLTTNGSLPSADSLGATEMSKYFPTSRTPGDMDVIPDPYRLSRNYSTSTYTSKTEPVPFLTDFSAFLK